MGGEILNPHSLQNFTVGSRLLPQLVQYDKTIAPESVSASMYQGSGIRLVWLAIIYRRNPSMWCFWEQP